MIKVWKGWKKYSKYDGEKPKREKDRLHISKMKILGSIIADDINALNAMKACTILYIPFSEYGE